MYTFVIYSNRNTKYFATGYTLIEICVVLLYFSGERGGGGMSRLTDTKKTDAHKRPIRIKGQNINKSERDFIDSVVLILIPPYICIR